MNKSRILRLLASIFVLTGVIVWGLPCLGIDVLGPFIAVMLVLLIVSAFYLAFFASDIEEDNACKRKRRQFEISGVVVIVATSLLSFFCPKAIPPWLGLILITVLYWFFFWRPESKRKDNRDKQDQSLPHNEIK
jgi:predicted ABC-type exoprotein transport system permease subunit